MFIVDLKYARRVDFFNSTQFQILPKYSWSDSDLEFENLESKIDFWNFKNSQNFKDLRKTFFLNQGSI